MTPLTEQEKEECRELLEELIEDAQQLIAKCNDAMKFITENDMKKFVDKWFCIDEGYKHIELI